MSDESADGLRPLHGRLDELSAAFARTRESQAWPAVPPKDVRLLLQRAERELVGVHLAELARVSKRAVVLIERCVRGPRLRAFQRRAAEAVAAARDSGAWVPRAVERVVDSDLETWPSKLQLARAAFDLDPTAENGALVARFQAKGAGA